MTKSYNSPFEHVDYNAIIDGTKGNGIISGLTVTERGAGQNMSVDVAAGTALITWVKYTEASTVNVVITAADATHPRKDIIIYDVATTNPDVVTGTPAAEPIPPDITSGDILLAVVNVAANDTTIANTDIDDGRVTVQNFHHTSHEAGGSDEVSILVVSDTVVFNGAAPTVATTLDLSAVVGANRALCICKVDAGTGKAYQFLPTGTPVADGAYNGLGRIKTVSGADDSVLIITHTDGTCQWDSTTNDTVVLTILGYMVM